MHDAVDRALAGTFRLVVPLLVLALVSRAVSRDGLGPGTFSLFYKGTAAPTTADLLACPAPGGFPVPPSARTHGFLLDWVSPLATAKAQAEDYLNGPDKPTVAYHIIVGNDNNLPFSSGRALGKSDDNELILLKVTDLLQAK